MVADGTLDKSVMASVAGDSTVTEGGLKAPVKKRPSWREIWALQRAECGGLAHVCLAL